VRAHNQVADLVGGVDHAGCGYGVRGKHVLVTALERVQVELNVFLAGRGLIRRRGTPDGQRVGGHAHRGRTLVPGTGIHAGRGGRLADFDRPVVGVGTLDRHQQVDGEVLATNTAGRRQIGQRTIDLFG